MLKSTPLYSNKKMAIEQKASSNSFQILQVIISASLMLI